MDLLGVRRRFGIGRVVTQNQVLHMEKLSATLDKRQSPRKQDNKKLSHMYEDKFVN